MTNTFGPDSEPLWLAIEQRILELGSNDLTESNLENTIQGVAKALDDGGNNVSNTAGHMMALRGAIADRVSVGRPLMEELEKAFAAFTLDDLVSPYKAASQLTADLGADWPALKDSERRSHILRIVEKIKLDLLIAKAKDVGGDGSIRLLIQEEIAPSVIIERMEVTQADYDRVMAAVEAERAERVRVAELIEETEGKPKADRIKYLITSDVAEDLIIELAEVDQAGINDVKQAMEEEIAEKQRLAEEAAAAKAAAAAGPALDDIPADEMLEHIESIREILDFSDQEKEIRVMCEQSGVPKDLVEIAVSNPDRLDELEAKAEG
jgi:hypothetical protein